MKLFGIVVLCAGIGAMASIADPVQVTNLASTNLQSLPVVVQTGPHSRIWQRVVTRTNAAGVMVSKTNRFAELATGLNHFASDHWNASSAQILGTQTGAISSNCQHQITFSGNLNIAGAVDLQTPDSQHLRSQILGLAYYDSSSSNSVLFAQLQDSYGVILNSQTEAIYTNAFSGCEADVLYQNRKSGLEQDIILREQLPSPALWEFNPQTTWLQVWTEFSSAPIPHVNTLTDSTTGATDDQLDFGTIRIGPGRAFRLGDQSITTRVYKHWRTIENRTFLVEEIPLASIATQLQNLPSGSSTNTNAASAPGGTQSRLALPKAMSLAANPKAFLRVRIPQKAKTSQMQLASMPMNSKGFVLDYNAVNSTWTDLTCQSDTTYVVSGPVNVSGTVTFEGGTVIKYTNDPSAGITASNVVWQTAPYRPATFTALDDNRVGEIISPWSSGSPSGYYGGTALTVQYDDPIAGLEAGSTTVTNARFFYLNNVFQAGSVTLQDVQIENCNDVFAYDTPFGPLWNVLIKNIGTLCDNRVLDSSETDNGGHTLACVNVTLDGCNTLLGDASSTLNLVNCSFNNVVNWGDYFHNFDCSLINSSSFQQVGNAGYYLSPDSHGGGNLSIDPALLADLAQKTTYPPIVYADINIGTNMILVLQPIRDNSGTSLDIGYHYDPIDYAFGGVTINNASIQVTNGVVLAGFDDSGTGYGLVVGAGGQLQSVATPISLNRVIDFNSVQEESSGWAIPTNGLILPNPTGDGPASSIYCRFTDFSVPAQEAAFLFNTGGNSQPVCFQDCQFHGGAIYTANVTVNFTNCLFERVNTTIAPSDGSASFIGNSLFWYGEFALASLPTNSILQNNEFYGVVISDSNTIPYISGYNAYYGTSNTFLTQTNAHDEFLTSDPGFQTGPLGFYYQATNCPTTNMGSALAGQLGLYHYTTHTNELPQSNTIVDIGYHYIALGTNGLPLSTSGDGIGDYIKDGNGNGIYDPFTDLGNWLTNTTCPGGLNDVTRLAQGQNLNICTINPDTNGVLFLQVYTPLK